jgi:glycosyltransferase involved in cell wall biosynthesis
MKTLIKVTTVPETLLAFSKGHGLLLLDKFKVIGISSRGEELERFSVNENIETIPVNMHRRISVIADFVSIYRMFIIFLKEKPFIVHSMTPKAGLVSMLAGFLARVPHRIHTFTGLVFPTEKRLKRFILINIDRLICLLATKVIPEGEGVKRDLLQFRVTKKELKIIANGSFNGIDMDYFKRELFSEDYINELKQQFSFTNNELIFIFIGRLVFDKGVEDLVRAFSIMAKEYQKARLLLIGPWEQRLDPISKDITEIIINNNKIIQLPFQNDIRPYLAMSDIFVLPSHREGFPNSVLEAGAMGLPSIVTNINGSNEIIKNGVNGIIIEKQNVNELVNALIYMFSNGIVRYNMSKVSRQMIASRYDRKFVHQELLKMYMELS